jgi:hypothetical protein
LFIVAWLQASAPSAPNRALQVAWLTSVFPATTAQPGSGERNVPGGMTISIGTRHPSLSGISVPTRQRNTYSTAARVTAGGELKLFGRCTPVPVKSTRAVRASRSTVTLTLSGAPSSIV